MLSKVMNWVSRHILLAPFMCLFLLFGCGSSHKSIKTDAEVIRKDSTRQSLNIEQGSSLSLVELVKTHGHYKIDFRIYDTRKPPDSLTGKPPLLADGQVDGEFNRQEDKKTVVADTTTIKADKKTASSEQEETNVEEVKEKEAPFTEQIKWVCVLLVLLLVLFFVIKR